MVYVIDKKASSKDKQFTDFNMKNVASGKKALFFSKEDAYYFASCAIKDHHAGDAAYTMDRYEFKED